MPRSQYSSEISSSCNEFMSMFLMMQIERGALRTVVMFELMCKFSQERINTVIYIVVVELIKLREEMDCEHCQDIIMCLFVTIS